MIQKIFFLTTSWLYRFISDDTQDSNSKFYFQNLSIHINRDGKIIANAYFISEKSVLLEHITEDVLPQREINSYNKFLGLSIVVCLFILVNLLKYCKEFYSQRRNFMNQMSQEDDLFITNIKITAKMGIKDQAILYKLEQFQLAIHRKQNMTNSTKYSIHVVRPFPNQ